MKAILTKSEKERLLEQFEKSGKTHAQFAEENGLNIKTLSKWIYEWHHQIQMCILKGRLLIIGFAAFF